MNIVYINKAFISERKNPNKAFIVYTLRIYTIYILFLTRYRVQKVKFIADYLCFIAAKIIKSEPHF